MENLEVWKDVIGFEGLYQVSSLGRVKSLDRYRIRSDGSRRFYPERIVNPIIQHTGYAHVGLWRDTVRKQARLHRVVAEAFCPNDDPEHKTQVNHINEDKLDNRACNLEWCTPKHNTNFGTCITKRVSNRRKGVYCLDKNTHSVVAYFKSNAEANAWCGVRRYSGSISDCCRGIQKSAHGYCWSHVHPAQEGGDAI